MTKRRSLLFLLSCVALILLISFALEKGYGVHPCILCKAERMVYVLIVGVGVAAMLRDSFMDRGLTLICLLFAAGCLVSLYHVAIQQGFFSPPAFCVNTLNGTTMSVAQLRAHLLDTPTVPCHVVNWSLFGTSLAGYNALITGVFSYVALRIGRKK